MFCPNLCPNCRRKTHTPSTNQLSISVRPIATTIITSVQPSKPYLVAITPSIQPPKSTSTTSNVAHVRFYSTDQLSLETVLRSSASTIHSVPEEGKKP